MRAICAAVKVGKIWSWFGSARVSWGITAQPRSRVVALVAVGWSVRTSSVLDKSVVRVAIEPALARLRRADHGVLRAPRVLARVLVRRGIAAPCPAAALAGAQVDPSITGLDAVFARTVPRVLHGREGPDVSAGFLEIHTFSMGRRVPRSSRGWRRSRSPFSGAAIE